MSHISPRAILNSYPIFISVGSMDLLQIFRMRVKTVQSERWSLPHSRQSPDMTACILSTWNVSLHDVSSLKSHEHRPVCTMRYWKAVLVGSAHLTRPMPGRPDPERVNVRYAEFFRRLSSDAGGVNPMGFRQSSSCSIELRESARTCFHWPDPFEPVEERPSRRVDGRGVLQRRFRPRLHMGKVFASHAPVLFERQIAFLIIVLAAGANQIADSVRAPARPWDDVIDVQDLIAGAVIASVDASMVEFDQHVFAQFKVMEFALLIFNALDLGVLHQLRVEFDEFHRDAFDRIRASEPASPCVNILDAAFERRRQPAFRSPSVIEARLPGTGLSGAASTAERAPRIESGFDHLPAMLYFGGEDDLPAFLVDDRDSGRFRAGIDLQLQVGQDGAFDLSLENDGERVAAEGGCLARLQQQTGSARCRRRQRFFGRVQNWYSHNELNSFEFDVIAHVMFAWTMIFCGLFACDTGFAFVACLIASLRVWDWRRIPE
jgi:hypothetical protein